MKDLKTFGTIKPKCCGWDGMGWDGISPDRSISRSPGGDKNYVQKGSDNHKNIPPKSAPTSEKKTMSKKGSQRASNVVLRVVSVDEEGSFGVSNGSTTQWPLAILRIRLYTETAKILPL